MRAARRLKKPFMTLTDRTPQTRREAEALDANDPLGSFRDQFDLPAGVIYLDGNSLGPPSKAALDRSRRAAEGEWRRGLIASWNDAGWIDLPKTCGAKIAKIIGVDPEDVIVCDSVSANIFKLAAALMKKRPGALACETGEFPTDGYILEGLAAFSGAPLRRLDPGEGPGALCSEISVLIKSLVHYKSAAVADMAAWERAAAENDIAIIWDLSHAAGVIDLDLNAAGAKYAVGCGYKFLNGGPGAPAYIYIARDIAETLSQPLSGWMGHAAPFDFAHMYEPAPGVVRFACGTPPILSLSALDGALDLFDGLDMGAVEAKARALGDLFLARAVAMGFESASPGVGVRRGGHIALRFEHGYAVVQAMIARGVIGDFRAPDLMRFGFSPLFLTYAQVWDAADILQNILKTEEWRREEFSVRKPVT